VAEALAFVEGAVEVAAEALQLDPDGYRISRDGALSLLDADGRTGVTGPGPIDMALSRGSRFLYSLNSGDGTISGFRVRADGGLSPIGGASGLPNGANGLAAR